MKKYIMVLVKIFAFKTLYISVVYVLSILLQIKQEKLVEGLLCNIEIYIGIFLFYTAFNQLKNASTLLYQRQANNIIPYYITGL